MRDWLNIIYDGNRNGLFKDYQEYQKALIKYLGFLVNDVINWSIINKIEAIENDIVSYINIVLNLLLTKSNFINKTV
ncbi:hypothetical protein D3C75_1188090 [compost metagenome]